MSRIFGRVSMAVAVLAIVALCAPFAAAQPGGGQGRGGGFGGGQGRGGFGRGGGGASITSLAANEQVQGLLKLTDAQKTKVTEINTKLTEDRQAALGGGGGPEAFTEMQKMASDADMKVAEALDAAQNTNVLSILVQASGGPALSNAVLAKQLKLTDEQKTKLTEVAQNARGGGRGARGGPDQTPEEAAAARAERDKPYLEVLTADQKAEWAKLEKAQKVDDELLAQLRRGGGRGRGGRRGGM